MTSAPSRSARQARIRRLIESESVTSQTHLAGLLAGSGIEVTQATLSRDLEELGAVKMRGSDGAPASYVLPPENAPLRPAQTAPVTRALSRFDNCPSGSLGNSSHSHSAMTRPRTRSPRNSSRS